MNPAAGVVRDVLAGLRPYFHPPLRPQSRYTMPVNGAADLYEHGARRPARSAAAYPTEYLTRYRGEYLTRYLSACPVGYRRKYLGQLPEPIPDSICDDGW